MQNNYINWTVFRTEKTCSIDKKDRQILALMSGNSRISLKDISKRTKISKVAVFKRVQRLEKDRIITGYTCFVDFQRLGIDLFQVKLKLNMTGNERKEFLDKVMENPYLSQLIVVSSGMWDVLARVFATRKTLESAITFFDHPNVERFEISQVTNIFFTRRDVETTVIARNDNIEVDRKDLDLLYALATDSRKSILGIASDVGMSVKQAAERIRKLRASNVILADATTTNPLIYGGQGIFLFIEAKSLKSQKVIAKKLAEDPSSTGSITCLNGRGILSCHIVEDMKELEELENVITATKQDIASWFLTRIDEQLYYNFFPRELISLIEEIKRSK